MAGERTQDATPFRLRQARREGNVPRAADLASAVSLLASLGALTAVSTSLTNQLVIHLRSSLSDLQHPPGMYSLGALIAAASVPVLGAGLVAGLTAQFAYTGPVWTNQPLKFDWSKLNPLAAAQRYFSRRQLAEAVRLVLKGAILVDVIYRCCEEDLVPWCAASHNMVGLGLLMTQLKSVIWKIAWASLAVAVLDGLYQRWEYRMSLRMSKDEVKREFKQNEGDPLQKGRRRALARKLARNRSLEGVKKASVVITNPTHLAVALEYKIGKMKAPRVVARGQGLMAQAIKRVARKHRVPTVEDKPLARALFKLQVNQSIPPNLYKAVAEVLVTVARAEDLMQ